MLKLKLTDAEHARLAAALETARAKTSARLEVAVVPVSDRYQLYPVVYGAAAALLVQSLLALFVPALSFRAGFGIEVAVFAAVALCLEWLPLRMLLVPLRARHWEARELAHRAFASRILAAHERRPGMVLFVSLGERYVELVTDDELDRRVGQAAWNRIVADFTGAMKAGRTIDGLEAAALACGVELARHFPN